MDYLLEAHFEAGVRFLARAGWTEDVYEEFIRWHDDDVAEKESPDRMLLTNFSAAA